jgi:very-short-patch-repair endonuclease
VAIEVDGPSHFLANKQNERVGATKLREQFLEYRGWTVRV